ncbi:hypothetical protein EVAR_89158_1 [Eumeta japonica]|uniref:Uncharacterized protein n=1 Tax=Eumeta variegata TaxID=151549 RepID=A0A4C1Z601_EUMVA|nr:hypothetical protein EVAR_89158_1 [Eumeta japonica]
MYNVTPVKVILTSQRQQLNRCKFRENRSAGRMSYDVDGREHRQNNVELCALQCTPIHETRNVDFVHSMYEDVELHRGYTMEKKNVANHEYIINGTKKFDKYPILKLDDSDLTDGAWIQSC